MGSAIKRVANYAVSDTAYGTSWDGVTDVAPSKNAVYDKIETLSAGFPGEVRMYAGATAPTEWLLCDGASYLQSDYPALFAVIGTTYGSADGTHFNVPDFRGRSPIGVGTGTGGGAAGTGLPTGGTALTAVARGGWKGEENHVLSSAENATHSHKVNPPSTTSAAENAHTHTFSGDTGNESAHTHLFTEPTGGGSVGAGGYIPNAQQSSTGAGSAHKHSFSGTTSEGASHTHAVDIAEFDSGTSGSGTAHNTIQPVMGINFIIKT